MEQLSLAFYGKHIDVDGRQDRDGRITYRGKAMHVHDNTYRCLAQVDHALCVVEVTVKPAPQEQL